MSLKLLLRCGVINVSPKVEFIEPNKRFRVEDKFAVLLGELPGDSCLSKVLGHSRRIVSNCSITDCSPLYFSRCLPGRVHHVPGAGSGDSRNITRHHPGLWLAAGGGATYQWQARTRERLQLSPGLWRLLGPSERCQAAAGGRQLACKAPEEWL